MFLFDSYNDVFPRCVELLIDSSYGQNITVLLYWATKNSVKERAGNNITWYSNVKEVCLQIFHNSVDWHRMARPPQAHLRFSRLFNQRFRFLVVEILKSFKLFACNFMWRRLLEHTVIIRRLMFPFYYADADFPYLVNMSSAWKNDFRQQFSLVWATSLTINRPNWCP